MMFNIMAFLTLLVGYISWVFMYKIIAKRNIKFSVFNILFLLLVSCITTFLTASDQILFKLVINVVSLTLLIMIFCKEEVIKSLYYSFFIWISSIMADFIISIIILSSSSFYDIRSNYIIRSLIVIPLIGIQFLLMFFNRKWINKLYEKYNSVLLQNATFNFGFSLFIVFISFLAASNAYQSNIKGASYKIIAISFIILALVLILIKYIIRSYNLSILNKNIINENKIISDLSQKDQIFKHNLINNLLGIETVANKKTKDLINQLIISYKSDFEKISNINELPFGIQGLIYKKIYLKNIPDLNFIVENSFNDDIVELMTPKNYNALMEAIGILLDNALEATEMCDKKIIVIDTRMTDNYIYFEIKNTFNSIIDFDFLGKKNYTTKKGGHGIGFNHLLKNKNIDMKVSILDNLFCVEVITKLKK